MPKQVRTPDGAIHNFPDDATDEEISATLNGAPKATTMAQAAPAASGGSMLTTAKDVALGAAKGLGNTVYGLGKVVHDYTPIGRISDAIQPGAFEPANKPPELTPTNTAQRVGQGAEQIAEFFLPTGAAGKVGQAAEVAKAGLLTLAQSGDPTTAGISAGLTAAIPVVGGLANKASQGLRSSALETMASSLKATKEWAKDESAKLAPEMLKRGVGGSIRALRKQSTEMAAKVGQNLDDAYKAAAAAGDTVPGTIIQGNVQLARDVLHVRDASGRLIALPGHEDAIAQLDGLADFIGKLGPDIPVDKAAGVKQAWDAIVAKAGLYGQNATAPASEKAKAFAFREAANNFREMLNANPTIADLNKEAGFWIGLRDVVNATKLRKVGQTGGLLRAGGSAVGATVGGMTGDSYTERATNGVLGALAGQQFVKLVQSPAFMNKVAAPAKDALADALASGSPGMIRSATVKAVQSLPSQLRTQFSN